MKYLKLLLLVPYYALRIPYLAIVHFSGGFRL